MVALCAGANEKGRKQKLKDQGRNERELSVNVSENIEERDEPGYKETYVGHSPETFSVDFHPSIYMMSHLQLGVLQVSEHIRASDSEESEWGGCESC